MSCLLARTRKGLEEVDDRIRAGGGKSTLIPLNLANGKAIDALGPSLYERFGRLDVLVGNAAILERLSPLTHVPSELGKRASPSTSPPIGDSFAHSTRCFVSPAPAG